MKNNEDLLLTVYCAAYNQEAYIRRTLEGFVMQRTNFRFVAYVLPPIVLLILSGSLRKSTPS